MSERSILTCGSVSMPTLNLARPFCLKVKARDYSLSSGIKEVFDFRPFHKRDAIQFTNVALSDLLVTL